MILSKLQQQFIKDLLELKKENKEKQVIIVEVYNLTGDIYIFEFSSSFLLKLPLESFLDLTSENEHRKLKYHVVLF